MNAAMCGPAGRDRQWKQKRSWRTAYNFFYLSSLLGVLGFFAPHEVLRQILGHELTETEPHNVSSSEKRSKAVMRLGEELFITGSARQACLKYDTWQGPRKGRLTNPDRRKLFPRCMRALEDAQQELRSKFPDFDNRTCDHPELIHAMWNVPKGRKKLPDSALLGILSMVNTCPPGCVKLRLWTLSSRSHSVLSRQLGRYIQEESLVIQKFDMGDLCNRIAALHPTIADKVMAAKPALQQWNDDLPAGTLTQFSDLVRVFVLAAFGGVYLDCDMVVLRQLTPLLGSDFYYKWSHLDAANTAAMHFKSGSSNARFLMEWALRDQSDGWSTRLSNRLHPFNISEALEGHSTMEMLPTTYFDPLFIPFDIYPEDRKFARNKYGLGRHSEAFFILENEAEAVKRNARVNFFGGAFAFHFHNNWDVEVHPGSSADLLLRQFKRISRDRQLN